MNPKRLSQRERALTIYFADAKQKADFAAAAKELDLTASFLGTLCLYRGLETGIVEELREVMPGERSTLPGVVVKSKKRPRRPAARTKKS